MKRIFLTGANGYLGSTLLKYLQNDFQINALVYPSCPENFLRQDWPGVTFIEGDMTDSKVLEESLEGVDTIIHLAAIKGAGQCADKVRDVIATNVWGTHLLLEYAKRHSVKEILFASTYWAYGQTEGRLSFHEDMVLAPQEIYGWSKALSEQEIISCDMNYTILRFANIFGFGSGINPEEVIFHFIKSAFEGKPLILQGGGEQKLDFIFIDDVCRIMLELLRRQNRENNILNIGSGRPQSIRSLACNVRDVFQRVYGREVEIVDTSGNSKPVDRWLAVDKLKEKIGDLRLYPFDEALTKYIKEVQEKMYDSSSTAVFPK